MPKIPLKDKLLHKIDKARRTHNSGEPVLEPLTKDRDLGEVLQRNLDKSYKQRYNNHLAQLHYIGTCININKEKNMSNGDIRRLLGVTRQQYHTAMAINKAIKNIDVIFHLEEVMLSNFNSLSNRDLEYIRNGAWPEKPKDEGIAIQERLDKLSKIIRDLLGSPQGQ